MNISVLLSSRNDNELVTLHSLWIMGICGNSVRGNTETFYRSPAFVHGGQYRMRGSERHGSSSTSFPRSAWERRGETLCVVRYDATQSVANCVPTRSVGTTQALRALYAFAVIAVDQRLAQTQKNPPKRVFLWFTTATLRCTGRYPTRRQIRRIWRHRHIPSLR